MATAQIVICEIGSYRQACTRTLSNTILRFAFRAALRNPSLRPSFSPLTCSSHRFQCHLRPFVCPTLFPLFVLLHPDFPLFLLFPRRSVPPSLRPSVPPSLRPLHILHLPLNPCFPLLSLPSSVLSSFRSFPLPPFMLSPLALCPHFLHPIHPSVPPYIDHRYPSLVLVSSISSFLLVLSFLQFPFYSLLRLSIFRPPTASFFY